MLDALHEILKPVNVSCSVYFVCKNDCYLSYDHNYKKNNVSVSAKSKSETDCTYLLHRIFFFSIKEGCIILFHKYIKLIAKHVFKLNHSTSCYIHVSIFVAHTLFGYKTLEYK